MRPRQLIHAATTAAVAAGLLVVFPAATANAAPGLPPGFIVQDIDLGLQPGFAGDLLTDFAFLPDESIVAVGKNGKVNWVPKDGAPRQIASLAVTTNQDMGLQGIAVAPDYATSRAVYTTRTVPPADAGKPSSTYGALRLSRWTVATNAEGAPTALTDEQTMMQTTADSNAHGMSTVIADEDGTVWISIGDSSGYDSGVADPRALRALDLDDAHGKLLHVKADGSAVPTNPYYDPAAPDSVRSKIYASGFRSPFRFTLDPATKRPILGDVGWETYEEVNLVTPGASYGWPCWEGVDRAGFYRDLPGCAGVTATAPIWSYPRAVGGSVTGGVIYQGKDYPAEYQGRYFFGDYSARSIWNMKFDGSGALQVPPTDPWASTVGGIVKISAMPVSGDLVYADLEDSVLRRIVYAPGNNPPAAVITTQEDDPATNSVRFDAGKSSDPNGNDLTYLWEFGDGTTSTEKVVQHRFPASPDHFTVKLTVTDTLNASASSTRVVYPSNRAPSLTVTPPGPDQRFAVGDVISATATATDPEEGTLPISWSANMIHCRGIENCHTHPGLRLDNTPAFTWPFEGHSGDTRVEITAVTRDSKGAETSRTFTVVPKQRRITIQSNTPAEFSIGEEKSTTALFTVGLSVTITAPEAASDAIATFDKWADGAPRQRTLTVPDTDLALPISYLTPIDRRYNSEAAVRGVLGAPTGVEQGDGPVRWRPYENGRMYWTPETGPKYVAGAILQRYLEFGGHPAYGVPITDELTPPDGRGRYSEFSGGGRAIYWTPEHGARMVFGTIYLKWRALGAEAFNGYPTTDEVAASDNVGRFNAFERGSVYWHPEVGAFEVHGQIFDRWGALGREQSIIGYPITDELATPDGVGRYNHFQAGSIYWSSGTGAWEVHGSIRQKWAVLGWEKSPLGYPVTNEGITPDGIGRYNHFQSGSVYWHPNHGAFGIYGAIRERWAGLGWERSYLGYPVSDEYSWNGLRRSDFQFGYVTFNLATGQLVDRRY